MKLITCSKCKETKSVSEFHKHKGRKSGYNCWCKSCKKKAPSWNSPGRQKRYYDAKGYLTRLDLNYGDGAGKWYEQQLVKQDNCCAICGIPQDQLPHKLSLDHNHITGKWRGLLCKECNRSIGGLCADEGTELLSAAIIYIKERN